MKIENDQPNKAAITSRNIAFNKSLISHVYYDEDGDWQFFDGITIKEEDAIVVSIQQILALDPTLKSLPEMEIGESATRSSLTDSWKKF